MKDKTHDMNRGYSAGEADNGFERINPSEVFTRRQYKNRQLEYAGLDTAIVDRVENYPGPTDGNAPFGGGIYGDTDVDDASQNEGGFLPRTNYQDRF